MVKPGSNIQYETDGLNRRISKIVNGTTTAKFIWQDQLKIAAELNANGTLRKQFYYLDGVNSPEYMLFQGRKFHFIKDHRGSINFVIDTQSGSIAQKIVYSEFGEVLQDTNPGFQPFGFAGGLYDQDTRLVRFGARDYDGRIGRWLQKDPIRFDGGDTNLYGYVLNDPLNLIDPNGKSAAAAYAALRIALSGLLSEIAAICTAAPDFCYSFIKPKDPPTKPTKPKEPEPSCNPAYQSCQPTEEPRECK